MSRVLKVSSPSYWQYAVFVMSERLKTVCLAIQASGADLAGRSPEIPKGVLEDIQFFFELALDGVETGKPKNPVAASNAQTIATHILPVRLHRLEEINLKLKSYADFVEKLSVPHSFNGEEVSMIYEMQMFFFNFSNLTREVNLIERNGRLDYWSQHSSEFWSKRLAIPIRVG